jgi:hypothetical protein
VGKNLVQGLWKGIKNAAGWLWDKITGFGKSVVNKFKDVFGINSPAKTTEYMGKMLDEGLSKGVLRNMDEPLDAMAKVAGDMLNEADSINGLTFDRQLQHTFAAPQQPADGGLGAKLDKILAAIEKGQIITLDSDTLVGATANKYDMTFGRRNALAARGAL